MTPSLLAILLATTAGLAADHPVAGKRLLLRDPGTVAARRVVVRTAAVAASIVGADPRVAGATLQIGGDQFGDGASGAIALPAAGWTGLGAPAGSRGYRFLDRTRANGIETVSLKASHGNVSVTLSGGGAQWPYAITHPQGPIDVRLATGADVYCARFTSFTRNLSGEVLARPSLTPAACAPAGCGDGTADYPEACDDGARMPGDGCSETCQLENPSAVCAGVPTTAGTALHAVLVTGGLDAPVFVTSPPLDPYRLFVVQQNGLIRIVDHGVLRPTPFLDLHDLLSCCFYAGALGMTFHPNYAVNGLFFVNYTNADSNTEVRRFHVGADPNLADPTSGVRIIVMPIDPPLPSHNGGLPVFGPDGYLYVSMGDGYGLGGDGLHRAQDVTSLQGKLLRLDVDGAVPYAIPPSNPFVGVAGARPELWATGLRNPFRISFDRATGDLYVADVGQEALEEVDVQPAGSLGGENYGWSVFEGDACFAPPCPSPPTGFTFPVLEYDHSQGCAVTGGYVYRGCRMPDLRGSYFYSDVCSGFVRSLRYAGGVVTDQRDRTADMNPGGGLSIGGVTGFGEDARGELYVVDYGDGVDGQGEIYRIDPGS